MAGKRILDAIALASASRNILAKHFEIRLQQIDLYSRTSSIGKSVRQRIVGSLPYSYSSAQAFSQTSASAATSAKPSPPNESVAGSEQKGSATAGVGEENAGDPESFSQRPTPSGPPQPLDGQKSLDTDGSGKSTIPNPDDARGGLSSGEARQAQRDAETQIPSESADPPDSDGREFGVEQEQDVFYQPPGTTSPVLSALPRVRLPKVEWNEQGGDSHVPEKINSDVYYSRQEHAGGEEVLAEPSEEELSKLFHSPRAARLLSKKTSHVPSGLGAKHFHTTAWTERESPREREEVRQLAEGISKDAQTSISTPLTNTHSSYEMKESRVPSSRMGRVFEFGGLAASMAFGAVGSGGSMFSPANMERLVAKLSKMRGAALKLGQMMSFQDKVLPPPIAEVLRRVQDSADYMPASQRNAVIASNLGSNWRDLFQSFDEKPIAAASIGQVHSAVLKSSQPVAVKVQYPGVADSISSDLSNLSLLLHASRLLPPGLYLDKTIANARVELAWECDYLREAECAQRFHDLLADDTATFTVPRIYPEASGPQVLTMKLMSGTAVTKLTNILTQSEKDWIGTSILRLCLREIIEFKYMQTDPNWTNFLYNKETQRLELLDFGATRSYPTKFIKQYISLLAAASMNDRPRINSLSIDLGYLTGYESKTMLDAHTTSILTLAEPFMDTAPEVYGFQDQTITDRVRSLIPVMVRERLRPPPEETYSLHRKLSGAFLLCARLGSKVKCRELFKDAIEKAGLEEEGRGRKRTG